MLYKPIGQLSDGALALIVRSLLKLHVGRLHSTLTGGELKKRKRLATTLKIKPPAGL